MSGGLFENGNRRKAKIILRKLGWSAAVMCLMQIQGYLPSLDFLSPSALKMISFGIAVALTASKGVEMFWDKTSQLLEEKQISFDTETVVKPPDKP